MIIIIFIQNIYRSLGCMCSHGQCDKRIYFELKIKSVGPHEDLGLLHDISNFHYKITEETPTSGQLYVFDWDQDLCSEGGSIVNGEPIPQANHPEIFLLLLLDQRA
jgi:hypothetical protein